MERNYVSSSNIVSVGYDPDTETLEVEFQNSSVYQYYNVGRTVYDEFMKAASKGEFLAYQIRDIFPYSRVG